MSLINNPFLLSAFFISGAGSLMFEMLWFRQSGLILGNSVESAAIATSTYLLSLFFGNIVVSYMRRPAVWLKILAVFEVFFVFTGAILLTNTGILLDTVAALMPDIESGSVLYILY